MKNAKLWLFTVFFIISSGLSLYAQQKKKPAPVKKAPVKTVPAKTAPPKGTAAKTAPVKEEPRNEKDDQAKVRDMVTFLEFMLNTLGSSTTSARDKEVLITQSYSKVFRDAHVQIEDDLDADRTVTTNKDIVAYLKDVDFFFTDVKFEFVVDEIKSSVNADAKTYYKVSLKRNLKGTNTDGVVINNTVPRYIEVNYDPDAQDLKIVSIYTHEINEKDALVNWWKDLSLEWQEVFKKKLKITADSLSYSDVRTVAGLTDLDLSNNSFVQNIEPLARLVKLQSLNIAGTAVSDVSPLRNLTELSNINFSTTKILDLAPLKYCDKVEKLNISHTGISDITVLQKMPGLHWLDLSATTVTDLTSLSTLTGLQYLNISHTKITDLSPVRPLTQLTELSIAGSSVGDIAPVGDLKSLSSLNIDSTSVSSLAIVSGLENLKTLMANSSSVADLKPLQKLAHLERIYADHTAVKKEAVEAFALVNPKVLIVFNSDELRTWWQSISPSWQEVFSKGAKISVTPGKEELAKVPLLDSVSISGLAMIRDLEPLRKLYNLKALRADKTSISSLEPIADQLNIAFLDISETAVADLTVTRQFTRLKELRADRSKIQTIAPLNNVVSLQKFYADETEIHDITAREFLEKNHACLLIYKTIHLNRWWKKLDPTWKAALQKSMKDTTATRENLHRLAELETLSLKDAPVSDLTALSEFVRLKELDFSGTSIADLTPLAEMTTLRSLHATNGPLQNIAALQQLKDLEDLDISNTPIDDMRVIETLENLTKFNCSGTQIKRLDALDKVQHLDYLDCSNTKVGNLDGVSYLPLKTLKCYNTKISARQVENFKKAHPDCNVVYYR